MITDPLFVEDLTWATMSSSSSTQKSLRERIESAAWSNNYDELKRIAKTSAVDRETMKVASESVLRHLYSRPLCYQEDRRTIKIFKSIDAVKSIFSLPAEIDHLDILFRGSSNGYLGRPSRIQDDLLSDTISFAETLIRELADSKKLGNYVPSWMDDPKTNSDNNILDNLFPPVASVFYRGRIVQLLLEHCPSLLNRNNAFPKIEQAVRYCTFDDTFQILETLILAAQSTTTTMPTPLLSPSQMEQIFRLTFVLAVKSQRFVEHNSDHLSLLINLFVTKCGVDPTCLLAGGRVLCDIGSEEESRRPDLWATNTAFGGANASFSCTRDVIPLTSYYRYLFELGLNPNCKVPIVITNEMEPLFCRLIRQHAPAVPLFLEYGADETVDFKEIIVYETEIAEICGGLIIDVDIQWIAEMQQLFAQGLELRAKKRLHQIAVVTDVCGAHYSNSAADGDDQLSPTAVASVTAIVGLLPPLISLVVDYCQNFAPKIISSTSQPIISFVQ